MYISHEEMPVVSSWLLCLHKMYFINVEKLFFWLSFKNVLMFANTQTFAMNLICYYLDKYLI